MRADGIEQAVGLVMAPHWSGMSVETYVERVAAGGRRARRRARVHVRAPAIRPSRVRRVPRRAGARRRWTRLAGGGSRRRAGGVLGAHRCPTRTAGRRVAALQALRLRRGVPVPRRAAGDGRSGRREARARGLHASRWQSAGRTADPWWGPPVEDVDPRARRATGTPRWSCARAGLRGRSPRDPVRPRHRGEADRRGGRDRVRAAREMPNADPDVPATCWPRWCATIWPRRG